MAPARPTSALLGALLLARCAREAGALQPVGDAAGDEAPALEKEEWPRRRARRGAGQLAWMTEEKSLHGFQQGSETDDDLDLHDGLPPSAGCYMRMFSGCPKQPMRTQAWRRDKTATERGLDEEGCHQRKQVWERYCGSEDAEMMYVSGKASSGPVSALQVDAAWWPWGKKHESTKQESTSDEKAQAVPLGEAVIAGTEHRSSSDEKALVGNPSQPGCYMRMPSGCPKKPTLKTHLWRHDAWAEAHELDKAGCEERKRAWDKYCEADDAKMFFVPKPPKQ